MPSFTFCRSQLEFVREATANEALGTTVFLMTMCNRTTPSSPLNSTGDSGKEHEEPNYMKIFASHGTPGRQFSHPEGTLQSFLKLHFSQQTLLQCQEETLDKGLTLAFKQLDPMSNLRNLRVIHMYAMDVCGCMQTVCRYEEKRTYLQCFLSVFTKVVLN